jgi:catechol 2,3-dioxygenase-like lactoylglutathione lyase family enzyme
MMTVKLGKVTPILRMFDVDKAKDFYIGYLGFKVDWEHRFTPTAPVYMQVSRDEVALHLSEHHGDGCPGHYVRVNVDNIEELHAELNSKNYKFMRPGLETQEWGEQSVTVYDPSGNRVIFWQTLNTR